MIVISFYFDVAGEREKDRDKDRDRDRDRDREDVCVSVCAFLLLIWNYLFPVFTWM